MRPGLKQTLNTLGLHALRLVVACALPLTTQVGRNFEYEYCLFVALLLPLCAGAQAVIESRFNYHPERELDPPIFNLLTLSWLFVLGPIVYATTTFIAFRAVSCACSSNGFALWSLLQVWPALIFSHAIYLCLKTLNERDSSTVKQLGILILILAGFTLMQLSSIVWAPQVRSLGIYLGFIHGPIYDQQIEIDAGVALARGCHASIALCLCLFFSPRTSRRRRIISLSLLAILSAFLALRASHFPSVPIGEDFIARELGQTESIGSVQLHYSRALSQGDLQRLDVLKLELKFHIASLSKYFNPFPPTHVYIYETREQKKLLFGAGATDVTDVFTPSIHITLAEFPHPTLRHELVHAASSKHGFYGLGFHPNMLITEGLATALAPEENESTSNHIVSALLDQGRLRSLSDLFGPLFWLDSGFRAYTVADSWISYLIGRFGIASVLAYYHGSGFQSAFKESIGQVEDAWKQQIKREAQPSSLESQVALKRASLVEDECPHTKADFARDRSKVFSRLRQPSTWDADERYAAWAASTWPKSDEYALRNFRKRAKDLGQERVLNSEKIRQLTVDIRSRFPAPHQTYEAYQALVLQSDLLRILDDGPQSQDILQGVLQQAKEKNLKLGRTLTRQIDARLMLESSIAPDQGKAWRQYIAGWRAKMPEAPGPDSPWILKYLRLRQSPDIDPATLLLMFEEISLEQPTRDLNYEWYKLIGYQSFKQGNYALASKSLTRALSFAPDGAKAFNLLLIEMAEFAITAS